MNQFSFPKVADHLERSPELSQWYTPLELCERMIKWAHIKPGDVVLEPSCGDGRICRLIEAWQPEAKVIAIDLAPKYAPARRCDFLAVQSLEPTPTIAIMNPPYENNADLEHVLHAAELCGRVVALVRIVFLAGRERYHRLWRCARLSRLAILSSRPKSDGPGDWSAKSDYCVVEIGGAGPLVQVEWW
jgi:predicted RNA methylase